MLLKKLTKLKNTKTKENAQPKALKVLRFLPNFHFYVKNKWPKLRNEIGQVNGVSWRNSISNRQARANGRLRSLMQLKKKKKAFIQEVQ